MADGILLATYLRLGAGPDYPHRLAGHARLNGQPARRRIEVRYRRSGAYVISTVTDNNGLFDLRRLPPQTLSTPYVVTCYDDRVGGYGNALIFDRVYQVDDHGLPPQT